jgi:hypothetical protein
LLARLGDTGSSFGVGGVEEIGGLHLLAQKFLINEAIQNGAAVIVSELRESAIGEQSLIAKGFIPIGLQNNAAIDGGDDAVDYFGRSAPGRKREYRH